MRCSWNICKLKHQKMWGNLGISVNIAAGHPLQWLPSRLPPQVNPQPVFSNYRLSHYFIKCTTEQAVFLNGYRTHSNGVSFTLSVTTARLNWKLIYPNESLYFDAAQAWVLIIHNNSHSAGGHNEIVGHLE